MLLSLLIVFLLFHLLLRLLGFFFFSFLSFSSLFENPFGLFSFLIFLTLFFFSSLLLEIKLQMNRPMTLQIHSFVKYTFTHPSWCDVCTEFIWGVVKQGFPLLLFSFLFCFPSLKRKQMGIIEDLNALLFFSKKKAKISLPSLSLPLLSYLIFGESVFLTFF